MFKSVNPEQRSLKIQSVLYMRKRMYRVGVPVLDQSTEKNLKNRINNRRHRNFNRVNTVHFRL